MKTKKYVSILIAVLLILATVLFGCAGCAGKSAYDVAVKNGFIGTETEWLESLQGTNGTDGINGTDGVTVDYNDYLKWKSLEGNENATWSDFLATLGYDTTDDSAMTSSALRSAVQVWAGYHETNSKYTEQRGSGVLFKQDADSVYVLTNYHVVFSQKNNRVCNNIYLYLYGYEPVLGQSGNSVSSSETLYGGESIKAAYVGGSMLKDIAVLKFSAANTTYKGSRSQPLPEGMIGDSDTLTAGAKAVAVGNPMGLGLSASSGVIAKPEELLTIKVADEKTTALMRVIRIDTAINSGNSGGGLFDAAGRLIGIVNAKRTQTEIENVAYALPINSVIPLANSIIAGNTTKNTRGDAIANKCMLGIKTKIVSTKADYDNGLMQTIETVAVDSIAADFGDAHGLLAVDDVLVKAVLNGREITIDKWYKLQDLMYDAKTGDTVTVTVKRGDQRLDVSVPITSRSIVSTDYSTTIDNFILWM